MNKISLAEAIKLKSILSKKIYELDSELERVATVIVEKGETPKPTGLTVVQVEEELAKVRKDIRTLDRLVYRANIDNTIEFKGEVLPIVEAIELATQLRAEVETAKTFGQREKEQIKFGYGEGQTFYEIAMYDPAFYREKAVQLEKDAHKLSNLINAKNYTIYIEFDDSEYF